LELFFLQSDLLEECGGCIVFIACYCLKLINNDLKLKKNNSCYVCVFFSSGFILMIKLFAAGGSKIGVGLIVMIVTFSFAILALIDGLILIKVRQKM
jgi:hypothetical protein